MKTPAQTRRENSAGKTSTQRANFRAKPARSERPAFTVVSPKPTRPGTHPAPPVLSAQPLNAFMVFEDDLKVITETAGFDQAVRQLAGLAELIGPHAAFTEECRAIALIVEGARLLRERLLRMSAVTNAANEGRCAAHPEPVPAPPPPRAGLSEDATAYLARSLKPILQLSTENAGVEATSIAELFQGNPALSEVVQLLLNLAATRDGLVEIVANIQATKATATAAAA